MVSQYLLSCKIQMQHRQYTALHRYFPNVLYFLLLYVIDVVKKQKQSMNSVHYDNFF
jgi:hypothetical protein